MAPKTSRALVTWRYLPKGKAKHALRVPGDYSTALCGTSPMWFAPNSERWWGGADSQSQYEAVAALPECRRCAALLGYYDAVSVGTPGDVDPSMGVDQRGDRG